MVVNASRNLALMCIQFKEEKNPKHEKEVSLHHNTHIMLNSVPMVKHKHDMGTIYFICSILIFNFLLINSVLLVLTILNVNLVENGINVLNNVSVMLIVVMLSQMHRFQEEWTSDMGQVRRTCPHLNSKRFMLLVVQKLLSGKVWSKRISKINQN